MIAVPIHEPGRCAECDRRRARADEARILEIAVEAQCTITFGRDQVTMIGDTRLADLVLLRGTTRDRDVVARRFEPSAPEHGTRFMGGKL